MSAASFNPTSSPTITIDIVRGFPQPLKTRTETWEVPGLDGYGAQTLGQGDCPFELASITFCKAGNSGTDSDAADTHIAACAACQGQLIDISDNWGSTFDDVLITHYEAVKIPCLKDDGTGNIVRQVRVEARWRGMIAVPAT